jgi:hypothetical protein
VWRRVQAKTAAFDPELSRAEESASGRHDGAEGISGFCPPRADVFALGGGRELVVREPCSGTTWLTLRERTAERQLENIFYGQGGKWRAMPLAPERVLLINEGNQTVLLVADLDAARATYLAMPRELEGARRLEIQVAHGEIFVFGGVTLEAVGAGGCESRPPGRGCDPYVMREERPNRQVWAIVLADGSSR